MALVFAGVIALIADIGFRSIAYRTHRGEAFSCWCSRSRVPPRSVCSALLRDEPVDVGSSSRMRARQRFERPRGEGPRAAPAGTRPDHGQYAEPSTAHPRVESPRTGSTPSVQACSRSPASSTPIRRSSAHLGTRRGRRFRLPEQLRRRALRFRSTALVKADDRKPPHFAAKLRLPEHARLGETRFSSTGRFGSIMVLS